MSSLSATHRKLLYYVSKAIHDYHMIATGDKVLLCLSGGKDSHAMVQIIHELRVRSHYKFDCHILILDQGQPGWQDNELKAYLNKNKYSYEILYRDTYAIVKEKVPENKTYCGLCSRLRRGIIYRYAKENNFDKIALGHHRDDLIESLLMSIMYNGQIKSMPPKLQSDSGDNIVIRPLVYCQEKDLIKFLKEQAYPIIPCNLCGSQEKLARKKVKKLIQTLAETNPKIPSNMLRSLQKVSPSQLMDRELWDFNNFVLQPESQKLQDS